MTDFALKCRFNPFNLKMYILEMYSVPSQKIFQKKAKKLFYVISFKKYAIHSICCIKRKTKIIFKIVWKIF